MRKSMRNPDWGAAEKYIEGVGDKRSRAFLGAWYANQRWGAQAPTFTAYGLPTAAHLTPGFEQAAYGRVSR